MGCLSSKPKEPLFSLEKKPIDSDLKFKIVILGDVAVGKTSILNTLKGKC